MVNGTVDSKATFLLELYRKAVSLQKNELYEYFLDHAVKVTKSKIGFFHFVSPDEKSIILTTWNKQALKTCKADYSSHYPIEKAGNWADCIRTKEPVIYNDFKNSPNQKGLPTGHTEVSRIISFPLIENEHVIAIFGVGNKEEPYIQDDVLQLEFVSAELNKIIKQRRTEDEVRESKDNYHSLFKNMLDGFTYCEMVFNEKNEPTDFVYLEVNSAFEKMTGLKKENIINRRVTQIIPGIEKVNPELFEIYGRVSSSGKKEKFEVFVKPLSIWLSISAYSPKKGFFAAVLENITERKKAEEKLRETSEFLDSLISYANAPIIAWTPKFEIVVFNHAFELVTGLTQDEAIGKPLNILFPKNRKEEALRQIKRTVEGACWESVEIPILQKNGAISTLLWNSANVYDKTGKRIVATIAQGNDITERLKSEEALRKSEDRLKLSEQIAHLGSWELNIIQNKITWSDEVYRIFGLKPQEFRATYEAFIESVHRDDRAAVDTAYSNSLLEGKDGYEIEHRIIKKDTGEIRNVHSKCSHYRDKTGKIYRSVGMVHDITERKKVENALRESEERLQLKLESVLSPDIELEEKDLANIIDVQSLQAMMNYLYKLTKMGFALIDLKGNVLLGTGWQDLCTKFHRINSETLKNCMESDLQLTSGLQKGEVRLYKCKNNMWDVVTPMFIGGKHMGNLFFGQFFFEGENVDQKIFAAQAEKYGFNKESYRQAFESIPKFSREKVEYLMIFYSKLSEMLSKLSYSNLKLAKALINQKILQEKLEEKAREVAEYASQMEDLAEERAAKLKDTERLAAIGQTAGMVGHDIRNPLQSILGDLFLAKEEIYSIADPNVKASLNESLQNIENAIDYVNKIVADLQDFARPIKPNNQKVDVQKICEELLAKTAIPENIQVDCKIDDSARTIIADETLLKRIIINLMTNAVQAMPSGGKLTIRAFKEKQTVRIFVQDTGSGIPEEIKSKIFTPLFTTKSKGQGFGLAVVKRLTEALNGQVSFQSQVGEGTTFILRLPNP
jgi:PAS domain S-box-containing protein